MTTTGLTSPQPFREVHHLDVRLTYADCDPAGILYFAAWFPWMERLQSEWLFLHDLRQDTLAERFGFVTVTRSTECEYLVPAGLFDLVRVSMGIEHLGRSSFRSRVRMTRQGDGALVARGRLALVTTDLENRPVAVPAPLRELLTASLPAADRPAG
jgi:acyl-CoA thioester hydrolase